MAVAAYQDLCVDVVGTDAMTAFWAPTLGLVEGRRWPSVVRLDGPTPQHTVWLNVVPERPTVKNRVHWDVRLERADGVQRLQSLGARVLRRPDDDVRWTVMTDPEGNEFCAFAPADDDS